jgi:hypothetical protein
MPRSWISALSSLVLITACTKKADPPTTAPGDATTTDAGPTADDVPAVAAPARPPVELVRFEARVDDLEGVLAAGEQILAQVSPERPVNLHAVVESIATQRGLGGSFVQALDLRGRMGLSVGVPRRGQGHARPGDLALSASIAATNAAGAIESMADRYAPQPIGGGVWRSAQPDEPELLLRPTASALEIGRTPADLDGASALVAAKAEHTIDVRGRDLAAGDVDPGPLLSFAGPLSGHVSRAMERATEFRLTGDAAPGQELRLALEVAADLSDLGLAPMGPARVESSSLSQALPKDPIVVASLSWGDPALIHRELDRLIARIPAPFDEWVSDLAAGAHATIDAVRDEVVFAIYLDADEHASLLIAANVSSDAAGAKAVRSVLTATADLGRRYKDLTGDDREFRFNVDFRPEASTVSGTKVDVFTATVPKAFTADAKRVGMALGRTKPRVHAMTAVRDGVGFVAFGAGARRTATRFITLRRESAGGAESQRGLALARETAGGCGLCMAVNVAGLLRGWAVHRRDFDADPSAKDQLKRVSQLPAAAILAVAARSDASGGALGVGASPELLFAPPSGPGVISTAIELVEAVFLPSDASP